MQGTRKHLWGDAGHYYATQNKACAIGTRYGDQNLARSVFRTFGNLMATPGQQLPNNLPNTYGTLQTTPRQGKAAHACAPPGGRRPCPVCSAWRISAPNGRVFESLMARLPYRAHCLVNCLVIAKTSGFPTGKPYVLTRSETPGLRWTKNCPLAISISNLRAFCLSALRPGVRARPGPLRAQVVKTRDPGFCVRAGLRRPIGVW